MTYECKKIDMSKEFERRLSEIEKWFSLVGFPQGKAPGLRPDIAMIAATLNYGTTRAGPNRDITIPPRPFMETALWENRKKIENAAIKLSKSVLRGESTAKEALSKLSEFVVNCIKQSIKTGDWTPLADGSGRHPLTDTMLMHNSVTYKIEGK